MKIYERPEGVAVNRIAKYLCYILLSAVCKQIQKMC
jgi:hypothetical protein